jgi:ketosteroid isomerase-like protein
VSHTLGAEVYDSAVIDELRAAVDAFNRGDPEPFVALIDEDSEWRGISRGHLWWKHAPS